MERVPGRDGAETRFDIRFQVFSKERSSHRLSFNFEKT